MNDSSRAAPPLRVWDLPTRLFHWALVVSVVGAIIAVNVGGDAMAWHFRFGYAVVTLLLFRLVWGFVGPQYARFTSFPPRVRAAWRSLRSPGSELSPGHSPSAALSVYAMLLAASAQAVTGLFSNDAIMWDGPLRKWVSSATSDMITGWHLTNRYLLIGLIALHVAAIIWWRVRHGKRLTRAMLTGDSEGAPAGAVPADDGAATRLKALLVLLACAAIVALLVR
jgi:cytochrome b